MNSRPNCQARVTGDEYHCNRCGLVWGISDLDPPKCQTVFNVGTVGHIDRGPTNEALDNLNRAGTNLKNAIIKEGRSTIQQASDNLRRAGKAINKMRPTAEQAVKQMREALKNNER